MSHELDLAITLPGQPFILAAPAVTIIAILAIIAIRKTRRKKAIMATWAAASDELGLQFDISGTGLGPLAQGRVNNHVASIKRAHNGPKKRVVTQYSVKFEAPEAPKFNLVKRIDASTRVIDTGNPNRSAGVTGPLPDRSTPFCHSSAADLLPICPDHQSRSPPPVSRHRA